MNYFLRRTKNNSFFQRNILGRTGRIPQSDIFIVWSGVVPPFNIQRITLSSHYVRTAPELNLINISSHKKITRPTYKN